MDALASLPADVQLRLRTDRLQLALAFLERRISYSAGWGCWDSEVLGKQHANELIDAWELLLFDSVQPATPDPIPGSAPFLTRTGFVDSGASGTF